MKNFVKLLERVIPMDLRFFATAFPILVKQNWKKAFLLVHKFEKLWKIKNLKKN